MNASGFAVIGTPDDVAAQIERLAEQSGGFGTFLCMGHDWADRAATHRSYELLAREVFPRFQGSAGSLSSSRDWAAANRPTFIGGGRRRGDGRDPEAPRRARGRGRGARRLTAGRRQPAQPVVMVTVVCFPLPWLVSAPTMTLTVASPFLACNVPKDWLPDVVS